MTGDWAVIQDRAKVRPIDIAGKEDALLGEADVGGFLDRAVMKEIARAGQ